MSIPSAILVGFDGQTVLIRVEGKGTFLNSTVLKEFAKETTNRGYRDYRVDLEKCTSMDSTFMGTLAGIALRLTEVGPGQLRIVNLSERNRDLLCGLGLDQLMSLEGREEGPVPTAPLSAEPVDKTTQAQTMLEAHQDVVKANPENAVKFKDVIDYLEHDLRDGQ